MPIHSDLRIRDLFTTSEMFDARSVAWLGHGSDAGIRINHGRWGAREAPHSVLTSFGKMTPSWFQNIAFLQDIKSYDQENLSLVEMHENARSRVFAALKQHDMTLTVGGGHDFSSPDGRAFLQFCETHVREEKPWIINFDAHADVRPQGPNAEVHSGAPFRDLLESGYDFSFLEIGLGHHCNASEHLVYLRQKNVPFVFLDQVRQTTPIDFFSSFQFKERPALYLSVDIDVFCKSVAPGCSASWPGGLLWPEFEKWLQLIARSFRIELLGIYEVCPRLDQDNITSELAARIQFEVLRRHFETEAR